MKASTFLKPKEKLQSPEYLDYVYRNMLALLELKEVHKKDLKRRSLTEWEIQELMDKGYRSTEPEKSVWIAKKLLENGLTLKGVPGFFQNRDGNWEAAFYEGNRGYLCPVYSIDGKILGFQIRVEKPVNNRKYVWFTSSGLEGGTSSKSPAGVSGFAKVGITSIRVIRRNPEGRNRQFAKRSSVHRNSRCWKLPKLTACTIRSETAWP